MRLASILFLLSTLNSVEFGFARNIQKKNDRQLTQIPDDFKVIGLFKHNAQQIPIVFARPEPVFSNGRPKRRQQRGRHFLADEKTKRKRINKVATKAEEPVRRHQATFFDPEQVKAFKSQANFRGRGKGKGGVKKGKKTQSNGKDKKKKNSKKKKKANKVKPSKTKKPKGKFSQTEPTEIGKTTIFQPPTMPLLTKPTHPIRFAPINKRPGVMKGQPKFVFPDDFNFDA